MTCRSNYDNRSSRFSSSCGIAQGVLYKHQDSSLIYQEEFSPYSTQQIDHSLQSNLREKKIYGSGLDVSINEGVDEIRFQTSAVRKSDSQGIRDTITYNLVKGKRRTSFKSECPPNQDLVLNKQKPYQ